MGSPRSIGARVDAAGTLAEHPTEPFTMTGDQSIGRVGRTGEGRRGRREDAPARQLREDHPNGLAARPHPAVRRDGVHRIEPLSLWNGYQQLRSSRALDRSERESASRVPRFELVGGPPAEATVLVVQDRDHVLTGRRAERRHDLPHRQASLFAIVRHPTTAPCFRTNTQRPGSLSRRSVDPMSTPDAQAWSSLWTGTSERGSASASP